MVREIASKTKGIFLGKALGADRDAIAKVGWISSRNRIAKEKENKTEGCPTGRGGRCGFKSIGRLFQFTNLAINQSSICQIADRTVTSLGRSPPRLVVPGAWL